MKTTNASLRRSLVFAFCATVPSLVWCADAQHLRAELGALDTEIASATQEASAYSGGLLLTFIQLRLEVLKTTRALVQQRIHAEEAGSEVEIVVPGTKPDLVLAKSLESEIAVQVKEVAAARAKADRYTGGLVQAMAETQAATAANTLALLEQRYLVAKYGLALPNVDSGTAAATSPEPAVKPKTRSAVSGSTASDCLEIETFDSSVLDANDVFVELAWKADVSNSCDSSFRLRVTFTIYDEDEFELDKDSESVSISGKGIGKARGKMLISPPEKARRMARQGVSMSLR